MRGGLILAAFLVGLTVSALAQEPPRKRIQRPGVVRPHPWQITPELPAALKTALQAVGRTRYSGTRVVEAKNGPNRERHTEFVMTDGPRSRIEFPIGSPLHGQVIVENESERRQYNPVKNEVQVMPPRREEALGRIVQLAKRRIRFEETPGGMIAGQATELITLSDAQGNLVQKLWIEPKSGIFLRRELFDRSGNQVAYFEFTSVNLKPTFSASDFNLNPKGAKLVTPETNRQRIVRVQGYLDVKLPVDTPYRLEVARQQKLGGENVLVLQYVGKGHRVTLYQLRAQIDPAQLGRIAPPNIQTFSWQAGGSSLVLVGDLTQAELRALAARLGA